MIELSDLAIVVAVSDEDVLRDNLLRSTACKHSMLPIHQIRNARSASVAYNQGINQFKDKKAIIFVHQDVYLPEPWLETMISQIQQIKSTDWGVLGVFGKSSAGKQIGQLWDSGLGKELGETFVSPSPVETLDELLIIVNIEKNLAFDEKLPGFHLFGTDICATSNKAGLTNYAINAPVVHNSKRVHSLGGLYAQAYRYMKKKWKSELPLYAVCSKITPYGIEYQRIRFGLAYRRFFGLLPARENSDKNPKSIAKTMSYE